LIAGDVSTADVKTGAKLGVQLYILYFVGSIVGNGICGVSNAKLGSFDSVSIDSVFHLSDITRYTSFVQFDRLLFIVRSICLSEAFDDKIYIKQATETSHS